MGELQVPNTANRRSKGLNIRIWRLAFGACMLGVMVLSLVPIGTEVPSTGWDKTNHLLGFSVLAILGCWSYPNRVITVLVGLLAYGALIEGLQSLTPHRFAEWGDLLADGLGLLLGWVLVRLATVAAFLQRRRN